MINLIYGDCLEEMLNISTNSIDLILCDPPYGTINCKWDSIINLELMWIQLKRLIKTNKSIVIFGQEPFSSILRLSNINEFKYDWYWRKSRPSGFVNAKLKPLKDIETISVFSQGTTANKSDRNMPYNPQGLTDCNINWQRPKQYMGGDKGVNPARKNHTLQKTIKKQGYPRQILDYPNPNNNILHPCEKPVDLMEYLIKTYTNDDETILDFAAGSFTTAIACLNLNRHFIGIEKDKKYFEIGKNRVQKRKRELKI